MHSNSKREPRRVPYPSRNGTPHPNDYDDKEHPGKHVDHPKEEYYEEDFDDGYFEDYFASEFGVDQYGASKEFITIVRMRIFYIESAVKDCEYCDLFTKSKSFAELRNFYNYLKEGVQLLYEELPCEWQGLNRPRFCDKDVKESNWEKLSWDLDENTKNYLLSRQYISNYPAIVLHICYNTGKIETKIINGINLMTQEGDDTIVFEFFKYILSVLDNAVPPHMKNKFTHDKAKFDITHAEPTLRYEENFKITA